MLLLLLDSGWFSWCVAISFRRLLLSSLFSILSFGSHLLTTPPNTNNQNEQIFKCVPNTVVVVVVVRLRENIFGSPPPLTSGCMDISWLFALKQKCEIRCALEAMACHHQQTSSDTMKKPTKFVWVNRQRAISVSQFMISLLIFIFFFGCFLSFQLTVVVNIIATDRSYSGQCNLFGIHRSPACLDEKDTHH